MIVLVYMCRYADRAKQIMCKAVINEDPNAKVRTYVRTCVCVCVCVCVCAFTNMRIYVMWVCPFCTFGTGYLCTYSIHTVYSICTYVRMCVYMYYMPPSKSEIPQ